MAEVVEQAPDDVTLARAALAAAQEVPGVAAMSRGRYAIARTFGLGGAVVEGVQLTHEPVGLRVEVHVIARLVPLPPLADAVRASVAMALGRSGSRVTAVDVWIDDLRMDETEEERP